jgi:tRNA(fMet)-specific endonuclease VapC
MEPRYLLDTNTIIYIRRDKPQSVRRVFRELQSGEAALSVITFGELLYGVAKSSQPAAAIQQLRQITSFLVVLPLPEPAGHLYGELRAGLESKGRLIGHNDLWIAAHAKAAGLILVTNNEREFRQISGLKIENWAA